MSVNENQPHISVLPEDDANRQLVAGFLLDPYLLSHRVKLLRVAGGWIKVLEHFQANHIAAMRRKPNRFMILLIDFDEREDRLDQAKAVIPEDLQDRVFILGAWSEPEDLRKDGLGSYPVIGQALAKDCRENTDTIWGHQLLRHNAGELDRLRQHVRSLLFS